MGLDQRYMVLQKSRSHLMNSLPKSLSELPPRTMKDSYSVAVIPVEQDVAKLAHYITAEERIRVDRLLEDMDMFALCVAHKHILNPKRKIDDKAPHILVTVNAEVNVYEGLKTQNLKDIILSGHVTWTSESVIEVTEWAEQIVDGQSQLLAKVLFNISAQNALNSDTTFVNQLIAQDEKEKEILEKKSIEINERTEENKKFSLLKVAPTREEQIVIHESYTRTTDSQHNARVLPPNTVWMMDTVCYQVFTGYPSVRNMYNMIFNGFLLRHAVAVSWHAGRLYCKSNPQLIHVTAVHFRNSIHVGAIIKMLAQVVYTEGNYLQVAVFTDAYNSLSDEAVHSNSFNFTYVLDDKVKSVVPYSYTDAMLYIDGRRQFKKIKKLKKILHS
ncbi:acyl-coenzyme A thioesterase 10, mitochondrial-like [Periplaneta americana]|uniref:acyl-coenzyme A thioesterase 10, mitochondrial-like n=1 Tax=Periplaneta americana TaxID=6978 RepID=UPI0037E8A2B2